MAQEGNRSPENLLDELGRHAHSDALARLVHALAFSAFDEQRRSLDEGVSDAAQRLGVDEVAAETSYGNVLRAIKKGAQASGPERILLGTLLARGVALALPEGSQAEERVAEGLLFCASLTVADGLTPIDAALGERGAGLWKAIGRLVEKHDEGSGSTISRAAAIVGAAALSQSESVAAADERSRLPPMLRDPLLKALLSRTGAPAVSAPVMFAGESVAPPRSTLAIIALTFTLILPIIAFTRLIARHALKLRRPAQITVSDVGVTVSMRTELLGRTLRQREALIPRAALSRAARDVRYPRLATYVGVATLLIGSYVGLRLVLDGFKAASTEFLGIGIAILVLSLVLDFLLSRWPIRPRSDCEILFEPRRGSRLAFAAVDTALADAALARLRVAAFERSTMPASLASSASARTASVPPAKGVSEAPPAPVPPTASSEVTAPASNAPPANPVAKPEATAPNE